MHWADRMLGVLHPMNYDATILLGPSEGGQGGKDAPDGFPVSGRITYPSGAMAFFADAERRVISLLMQAIGLPLLLVSTTCIPPLLSTVPHRLASLRPKIRQHHSP